jgi:hypothetical protein
MGLGVEVEIDVCVCVCVCVCGRARFESDGGMVANGPKVIFWLDGITNPWTYGKQ